MRVFLSYNFNDDAGEDVPSPLRLIHYYLKKQRPTIEPFAWLDGRAPGNFSAFLAEEIKQCTGFLLLTSGVIGKTQALEARLAARRYTDNPPSVAPLIIRVRSNHEGPLHFTQGELGDQTIQGWSTIYCGETARDAESCVRDIMKAFRLPWSPDDGIPLGYPFHYEKRIIEEYVSGNGSLGAERIAQGCPPTWPRITPMPDVRKNPIGDQHGAFRDDDASVVVDARSTYHRQHLDKSGTPIGDMLTFPEAGPRAVLHFPQLRQPQFRVGILVSGGIAPGINAVIAGIVERQFVYHRDLRQEVVATTVLGYRDGFKPLLGSGSRKPLELNEAIVRQHAHEAGSIIGTSRANEMLAIDHTDRDKALEDVIHKLRSDRVSILYIIGGDGSMRAARALQRKAIDLKLDISIVGIPKTMDNDILWVWQSFGFLSAVERAREITQQLHTEAASNPRLCIIQLFGSDSGFIVSHTALGSGVCDLALIPEVPFTMDQVSEYIFTRLQERLIRDEEGPFGIVLMAETAIPLDVEQFLEDDYVALSDEQKAAVRQFITDERRVRGQTPDALRSAALTIVARVLEREIRARADRHPYWEDYRVFTNEPRHLIRAIPPSAFDVAFGKRLGTLAVDNAMAGYRNFMISQWLTEYVLVPLELVVLGRKRVRTDGIFWKSVRSSTGQPEYLAPRIAK